MTDKPNSKVPPENEAVLAPELHNSEQDDEDSQAQSVAGEAHGREKTSPLESEPSKGGLDDVHEQDLIEHMRDMEQSGRIDMDAYRGEPNLDDEDEKYGERNKPD